MAILDILPPAGDTQDFIVEIPVGKAAYTPADILIESEDAPICNEIPVVTGGGGGNIFIMSE